MSWQTGNPPKPGYYLVTYKGVPRNHVTTGVWDEGTWHWEGDGPKVLAWQPLPEPYQPAHWPQGYGNPDDLLQAQEGPQG